MDLKLKESQKKDKYLDLTQELKKTVQHESDVYTNYNWCSWYSHQRINKGTGGLGNKKTSGEHPNYCIIDISQNTEKSHGDLRRLAVTQTPVKSADVKSWLLVGCLRFTAYQPLWVIQCQIRCTYMNFIICNHFLYKLTFLRKFIFLLSSCFDPFDPQVGADVKSSQGVIIILQSNTSYSSQ